MSARPLTAPRSSAASKRPYDAMKTFRKKGGFDDEAYEESMLAFRSSNPHVPAEYRLDPESNCLGNSENLADMNSNLTLVAGHCRDGKGQWGEHQWCVAPDGTIVDPFFEWRFGPRHQQFTYRAEVPTEDVDARDYLPGRAESSGPSVSL